MRAICAYSPLTLANLLRVKPSLFCVHLSLGFTKPNPELLLTDSPHLCTMLILFDFSGSGLIYPNNLIHYLQLQCTNCTHPH